MHPTSTPTCQSQTASQVLLEPDTEAQALAQLVREYKTAQNLRRHLRTRLDSAVEEALAALQGFANIGLERRLRELKRLVHARKPVFLVTRVNE
jgi:hypothetical protein